VFELITSYALISKKKEMALFHLQMKIKTALFVVVILSYTGLAFGQEENLQVYDRWINWSNGKDMLVQHVNKQAFAFLDERDKEVAGLTTKENWAKRQAKVDEILMAMVGPFPEKTPLAAKITGTLKKEGYRVEKIVYESIPGFYVTGALYIPGGMKRNGPAILFTSGHTMDAFRYPSYQTMILNLVKKGFIVFAIDPIGQGERIQHYDAEKNASAVGSMTREHSYLGEQCFLSGASIAKYFIWDGIRAIDYLLTRKEVDPSRIGITGQSGGGTQAAYIFAFDKRIKAGAPVNFITGFRRLLESIGPQDAEQNFYHGVANGITHADLLEVRAPAPALIVSGTRDFFSIQGARETYGEVKNAYAAFGADENVEMVEDDWGHGYTPKLREGIYRFFQKHLGLPGNSKDEEIKMLDAQELKITTSGQVSTAFANAETVFSLNKKYTEKLIDKLETSRKDIDAHLKEVASQAKRLSGYSTPSPELKSVFRGRYQREGYSVEMYGLEGEGDCVIPLLLFVPDGNRTFPAVIYIHPDGKTADAAVGGKIEQLVKKGYVVAAPDLIGTGETKGDGSGVAMLIGRSITGIQAGDVTRVVHFLKSQPNVDSGKIKAIAFDEMCPTLIHAAAFDNSISSVSLVGAPLSYQAMAMNPFYDGGFFNDGVAGALTAYDLPDLIACISPRKITLVGLKDQMRQPASAPLIDKALSFPRAVYSYKSVSGNIDILSASADMNGVEGWGLE
jgi:dipeptidyl aminopeptidase/acylaminoacyl peptidase